MTQTENAVERLKKATATAAVGLEASVSEDQNLKRLREIQEEMEKVKQLDSAKERTARLEILEADMNSVRENVKKNTIDTSTAMAGLEAYFAGLGTVFANLRELDASEKQLIADAQAKVETAKEGLFKAKGAWFKKDAKVARANQAITNAEQGVRDAEKEAESRQKDRLRNASLDESLQYFQMLAGKLETALQAGLVKIEEQIELVEPQLKQTLAEMAEQAEILDTSKKLVKDIEAELRSANLETDEFSVGTPAYAKHMAKVSEITKRLRDAETNRDVALDVYNTKEKFVRIHEANLTVQQNLRATQLRSLKILQSNTKERVVSFANQLSAEQSGKEQEASNKMDAMGHQLDVEGLKTSAQVLVGTNKIAIQRLRDNPERLADIAEVADAIMEHTVEITMEMREIIENSGIDMSQSNFAYFEKKAQAAASE